MNLFVGWRIAQNAPNSALKLTLLLLACVLTTTHAQGMTSFRDKDCFRCFACLCLSVSKNAPAVLLLNYSQRETLKCMYKETLLCNKLLVICQCFATSSHRRIDCNDEQVIPSLIWKWAFDMTKRKPIKVCWFFKYLHFEEVATSAQRDIFHHKLWRVELRGNSLQRKIKMVVLQVSS